MTDVSESLNFLRRPRWALERRGEGWGQNLVKRDPSRRRGSEIAGRGGLTSKQGRQEVLPCLGL